MPAFDVNRRTLAESERERLERFLRSATQCEDGRDCSLSEVLSRLFHLSECRGASREHLEAFIRSTFQEAYGASIIRFMPRLFELSTRRGELTAAFGVRCAADEPLFLEIYLDRPIEAELERILGMRPERERIVEVGNLAAIYPGAARWMIMALTDRLYQEGYEWVVFTGTVALCNGFHRLGLCPVVICPASIERLAPAERAAWGSYYNSQPTVMAGNIRHGYHAMNELYQFPKPGVAAVHGNEAA